MENNQIKLNYENEKLMNKEYLKKLKQQEAGFKELERIKIIMEKYEEC